MRTYCGCQIGTVMYEIRKEQNLKMLLVLNDLSLKEGKCDLLNPIGSISVNKIFICVVKYSDIFVQIESK